MAGWVSPRLGIRFEWQMGQELELYGADDRRFLSSVELATVAEVERQRAEKTSAQLQQAVVKLGQRGMTVEQIADILGMGESQARAVLQGQSF